jgi:mannan endo-1,4-beta-mannosidase
MTRAQRLVIVGSVTVALLALVSALSDGEAPSRPPVQPGRAVSAADRVCRFPRCKYLGLAISVKDFGTFERSMGIQPNMVELYRPFGGPPPASELSQIQGLGATPLLQFNPHVDLADIAGGRYDDYLRRYASVLRRYGPVVLSFAPEPNGNWQTWGCGTGGRSATSAETYVAAWRHLHDVMGSARIIWLWDVNLPYPGSCPLASLWPGRDYVDWAGLDAYLFRPGDRYETVIGPWVRVLRRLTGRPFLIAETGVLHHPGWVDQLTNLISVARRDKNVIGLVYFDHRTWRGDFRIDGSEAFRRLAGSWLSPVG